MSTHEVVRSWEAIAFDDVAVGDYVKFTRADRAFGIVDEHYSGEVIYKGDKLLKIEGIDDLFQSKHIKGLEKGT